jgi:tetratricopeptide (TPR) repeat protein
MPTHFVGGDGTKVDRIKLFRNLPGLKWKYRLHEQIYDALRDKGRLEHVQAHVLHSGYDWTPEGQIKKRIRNERLLKLELQDSPNNPLILFHLGSEAHLHGQHLEAVRYLEQSIPRIRIGESYAVKAFSTLAGAKTGLGDVQGALAICEVALKLFPNDAELRFRTGQSLAALGRFKEAKEQFSLVKQCPPDYLSGIDSFILGPKCDHNLAMVCIRLGEQREAYEWLQRATNAGFAPSAAIFCEYAMDLHDFTTAKIALDSLKEITGMDETWSGLATRLAAAQGESPAGSNA